MPVFPALCGPMLELELVKSTHMVTVSLLSSQLRSGRGDPAALCAGGQWAQCRFGSITLPSPPDNLNSPQGSQQSASRLRTSMATSHHAIIADGK